MNGTRGFSPVSFLLGVATAVAAPTVWERVLVPVGMAGLAIQGIPALQPGPVSLAVAAALSAGAAWTWFAGHPASRKLSLWAGGAVDFAALQRRRFRFLAPPVPGPVPLYAGEWLAGAVGRDAPWSEEQMASALASQLTVPFRGVAAEPPLRTALHAVFALHAARKAEARDLLAELAAASGDADALAVVARRAGKALLAGSERASSPDYLSDRHAWSETALMGALEAARARGTLPTSEFGWLKSVDRGLFFALDSVGRPDSFLVEGLGAACQYRSEVLAGRPLPEPAMGPAVRGIRRELSRLGPDPEA